MTSEADRRRMRLSAGHWSCKPRTTAQGEKEAAAAAATQAKDEALETVVGRLALANVSEGRIRLFGLTVARHVEASTDEQAQQANDTRERSRASTNTFNTKWRRTLRPKQKP